MPVAGAKDWKPTAAAKGVRIVNPGGPNDHSGVTIKVIKRMKLLMKRHHLNFISVFNNMDKNCDGAVSPEEMRAGFAEQIDLKLEPHELKALFKIFDRDGDGTVDLDEMRAAFKDLDPKNLKRIAKRKQLEKDRVANAKKRRAEEARRAELAKAARLRERKVVRIGDNPEENLVKDIATRMRAQMKKHHMNFISVFHNMDKNADSVVDFDELRNGFRDAVGPVEEEEECGSLNAPEKH